MSNYLDRLKSLDDKAFRSQIQVMKMQIKILGTEVIIESYDKSSEHRKAFGNMFQTDDLLTSPREFKTERLIINRNALGDYHEKQNIPITVYHYNDILKTGDVVTFRNGGLRYRLKVIDKSTYGLSPSIIFRYELLGLPEDSDVYKLIN